MRYCSNEERQLHVYVPRWDVIMCSERTLQDMFGQCNLSKRHRPCFSFTTGRVHRWYIQHTAVFWGKRGKKWKLPFPSPPCFFVVELSYCCDSPDFWVRRQSWERRILLHRILLLDRTAGNHQIKRSWTRSLWVPSSSGHFMILWMLIDIK